MNLLVILLAGAVIGGLAGFVFRSGSVALHMALGTAGAFLAGAMGGEALLEGVGPVTMMAAAFGAVALVAGAHMVTRDADAVSRRAGQPRSDR
ncbi:MAG: hypothetical protein KGJ57_11760 [Sphingomonadales bacterium]|nr:hypothetical protein [Sphingomonadales bacterium]MDE2170091.1 hypothetical protein [Sphingomonadales bacterium]